MVTPLSASVKKIWMLELLALTAEHLPWWALFTFRFYPPPAPKAFVIEIKRRVYAAVAPFIAPDLPRTFFNTLDDTRGVVFGALVRHLLLQNQQTRTLPPPLTMDIAVPIDMGEYWYTFLTTLGYVSTEVSPSPSWRKETRSVECFERRLADANVSSPYNKQRIVLMPSDIRFSE
jgi:hypothetical protein